jgi:succinate dehydrogenase / fumarate reductase cytochrome b subunit
MAVTGILLVLFLIAHMLGNLKIFTAPRPSNHYAHWLRDLSTPLLAPGWYLWLQRVSSTLAVLGRIWSRHRARPARPGRPPGQNTRTAGGPGQLRGPDHALGWCDHPALRDLPILDLTTGDLNPVGAPASRTPTWCDFAPSAGT